MNTLKTAAVVGLALGLNGLIAAPGCLAAATNTTAKTGKHNTVDLAIFTGTIDSLDPQKFSLSVKGHEVIVHEVTEQESATRTGATVQHPPPKRPKKTSAPPAEVKTFKVVPSCKIVTKTSENAMLANLKPGDPVDVSYYPGMGDELVATEIGPPSTHPDLVHKVVKGQPPRH